jgi:hypothetical protein
MCYRRNLQRIADFLLIKRYWAYSIAFDRAKRQGKSFIDVRLLILKRGSNENFYLLAMPIRLSLASQAMADWVGRLLHALCLERVAWKPKLVGI